MKISNIYSISPKILPPKISNVYSVSVVPSTFQFSIHSDTKLSRCFSGAFTPSDTEVNTTNSFSIKCSTKKKIATNDILQADTSVNIEKKDVTKYDVKLCIGNSDNVFADTVLTTDSNFTEYFDTNLALTTTPSYSFKCRADTKVLKSSDFKSIFDISLTENTTENDRFDTSVNYHKNFVIFNDNKLTTIYDDLSYFDSKSITTICQQVNNDTRLTLAKPFRVNVDIKLLANTTINLIADTELNKNVNQTGYFDTELRLSDTEIYPFKVWNDTKLINISDFGLQTDTSRNISSDWLLNADTVLKVKDTRNYIKISNNDTSPNLYKDERKNKSCVLIPAIGEYKDYEIELTFSTDYIPTNFFYSILPLVSNLSNLSGSKPNGFILGITNRYSKHDNGYLVFRGLKSGSTEDVVTDKFVCDGEIHTVKVVCKDDTSIEIFLDGELVIHHDKTSFIPALVNYELDVGHYCRSTYYDVQQAMKLYGLKISSNDDTIVEYDLLSIVGDNPYSNGIYASLVNAELVIPCSIKFTNQNDGAFYIQDEDSYGKYRETVYFQDKATVDAFIEIEGDGYATFRKEGKGNEQKFTPRRIIAKSIEINLYVRDKISKATLIISHPIKEQSVTATIPVGGTTVKYGMFFKNNPAIFPSYSNDTVKFTSQTNTDVFVEVFNSEGESIGGNVAFNLKGR